MAIYKKGADPIALRASAERITAHAHECDSVRGAASGAVRALRGQWSGGDIDALMSRWPPIESQLASLGHDLSALAKVLVRNAGQQDDASEAGRFGPSSLPSMPGPPDAGGLPGYDLLKAVWTPIKGFGTAVGLLGTGLKIGSFLKNISNWDRGAGALANLKNAWGAGRLAEFGTALSPKNWGTLSKFIPALTEGGSLARTLGGVGKALGPIGVAFGALGVVNDIAEGEYGRAGYDTVMTGLGAAALMTPPPVDVICGVAAGAMAVGELVYDHWDDISDFASGAVDTLGDAASGFAHGVSDVADAVWPF